MSSRLYDVFANRIEAVFKAVDVALKPVDGPGTMTYSAFHPRRIHNKR